jgi:hypothetical protein
MLRVASHTLWGSIALIGENQVNSAGVPKGGDNAVARPDIPKVRLSASFSSYAEHPFEQTASLIDKRQTALEMAVSKSAARSGAEENNWFTHRYSPFVKISYHVT